MLATLKVSFLDIVNSDMHCQIPGKSWIWPNMSKFLLSVQRLFQVAMVTVVDDIICYKAYCMSASVVIIKPPTYSSCSNFGTSHKFCPHCRSAWKQKPMNAQAFMGFYKRSWAPGGCYTLLLSLGVGKMYKCIYVLLYQLLMYPCHKSEE